MEEGSLVEQERMPAKENFAALRLSASAARRKALSRRQHRESYGAISIPPSSAKAASSFQCSFRRAYARHRSWWPDKTSDRS